MKLSDRMKDYENVSNFSLTKKTPVIIRIDGKAFHSFTKGFNKPFDDILIKTMQTTMKQLCENIQNCVLGYTQSDEISLLLVDFNTIETSAYFDYRVQKLCSVIASMTTLFFDREFVKHIANYKTEQIANYKGYKDCYYQTLYNAYMCKYALFDTRCFNLPKEEVNNYFLWRQNDATRNSIQSVGQAYFTKSELHKKSCDEIQNMLLTKYNINWNNYPTYIKRGSCCVKIPYGFFDADSEFININKEQKKRWVIDENIPIFSEDSYYINSLL